MTEVTIKRMAPTYKMWNHSHLFSIMVHHCDLSWNQIEASLTLLYEKLVRLGFTYYDGQVVIVEPEDEAKNV